MLTSRRNLLKVGLNALPVISLSASVPAFVSRMAFAEQAKRPDQSNDNILVVLQLTGGNDGLNTVVPFADDAYHRARPKIGIKAPPSVVRLDDHFALNPNLQMLKNVFDAGHLAIVHGCGYPNPNRSHFRSMEIWHTANPAKSQPSGWLGHFLDHAARGGLAPVNPLNIGTELPQALVGEGTPVPSIEKLEDFKLRSGHAKSAQALLEREIVMELNKAGDDQSPAHRFLARQATNAIIASNKVQSLAQQGASGMYYGMTLGRHLQLISSLISANAGTRLFYLQYGNFDTHAQQNQMHAGLFGELAQGIWAFHEDMKNKGLLDKVTLMVFSEFGRRVAENSSQGTDHGAAAPMFVMGGKIKGGLHGKMPSLTDLDDGDLKFSTDFRQVYATLLDKWLNADSAKVLGGKFEHIAFL
jgi:uncharacterized protein (DUF1501 family)